MNCKILNFLHGILLGVLILLATLLLAPPPVTASPPTSYYDWGPYYGAKDKILGVTFFSSENLPAPQVPQDIMPPPAQGILPGSPLYAFEIFTENIQLTLTFNPVQRETQRLEFASERLSEMRTLIDQGKPDLANNAATIYKNTMDDVLQNTQNLSSQNAQDSKELVAKVEETAASHAVVAQSLALVSPPAASSSWTKVVDATEEAMDTTADILGQPAIPESLSASIQELKDQGLITPEESEKLYAFQSRADVRGELDKLATSGLFPIAEVIKLDQAVATNYPETYKETEGVLKFAELRTYQTFTPPSTEIQNEITRWQNQPGDTPPPGEIRPYLYYSRAERIAREIDFIRFEEEQQSEIARFFPEAVTQNPSFSGTPSAPSPSPTPSDVSPTPVPPSTLTAPYLANYNGPLPGTIGYFFKNIGEQATLFTTFDPARRLEIRINYADERLREARALSQEAGYEKLYEEALKRYQQSMDTVSSDVKDFAGSEDDKKDLARALESESTRHNVVFEKGLLPPPTSGETKVYTDALNASEDAMDVASDALGRPALPQALANRLQDMKAQGVILEEEVSDLTNASSREEVRGKIRDLIELGTFPPADAKKLDEAQSLIAPSDFNQLTEVRKIEELQRLRAIQAEFAQTASLRETNAIYEQRVQNLLNTIDPDLIKPEDLAGRQVLIKTYQEIAANAPKRPINAGQFGSVIAGEPAPSAIASSDSLVGTCPIGAVFKEGEGCVWEDNGKRINDYSQYTCDKPGQYWSFVSKACVPIDIESPPGIREDVKPICPVGYTWSWTTSSCETGGVVRPSPSPSPEPEPEPGPKSCPAGATYKPPRGCVWDENDKQVTDPTQYRCEETDSYYSFSQGKCVPNPDPEKPFPPDAAPSCEEGEYWSWGEGACVPKPSIPPNVEPAEFLVPKPVFVDPSSPFYFLKQAGEAIQLTTALGTQAREEVKLNQVKERLSEAYALLEKNDEEGFRDSLAKYTGGMQSVFNDIDKGLNLSEEAKRELGEKLAQDVTNQNLLLQKVSILASKDAASPISAATSVVTQGVDRSSDLQGQPPIPQNIKEKLDALPKDMLSEEQEQKLAEADTRLEARLVAGELTATGALDLRDIASFDNWTLPPDAAAFLKLNELKKLSEAVELTNLKEDIAEKVEKNEEIAKKLDEFKKTFEPGNEIPADVRPYVRLTRIDEISQTIRPDVVRLEDFGNRKDIQLATAALQQEFKPTKEDFRRVEDFRRSNPGRALPAELARIEALSFAIGVRDTATTCFLPSPPFALNTPCPPAGASIPVSSYYTAVPSFPGISGFGAGYTNVLGPGVPPPSLDKDGKPLVYGKGPEPSSAGVCPDGYHWMYDSGGWCMSNSGNYSPSSYSTGTPYTSGPGYTPYTPYYSAPGAPSYSGGGYYSGPNYYGPAPTTYTTNPPPGTVPGSGPAPTASGQCPSGYHWMPPSPGQAGWCMADAGTYTGSSGGYYGGSVAPGTSCPAGSYWNSYYNSCQPAPGYNYGPSPNLTIESCGPGYTWSGGACYPNVSGSGTYYGGSGPSPSNYCQGISCGGGSYLDYSTCSCRYSSSGSSSTGTGTGTSTSCYPPSGGCGSGWFDYGSCSCQQASSQGCYNVSASSCGSGFYWDAAACTCRSSGTSSSSSTGTTSTSGGGTTSSGSCPSGYHWMSDNGGWCMSDGTTGGSSGGTTSTPTSTSSEPAPAPTTSSEPAPAPTTSSEPAPAPAESTQPAPTSSP